MEQRHHFANKDPHSQSYGFSSSYIRMWELDHKEVWALKKWCFQIVGLEKTLKSPLDCKEIKPVNTKRNQLCIFIGGTDVEAEAPILWPPHSKTWFIGKDTDAGRDWREKEKGVAEDKAVRWHHWLDGHGSQQILGDSEGSKFWEMVKDRDVWPIAVHGLQRVGHSLVTEVSEVAQSCPTLCDLMDCSLPGSSLHGILQARVLEWGAIAFSRGSSRPRDWTRVSRIAGRRFTLWATRDWTPLLMQS